MAIVSAKPRNGMPRTCAIISAAAPTAPRRSAAVSDETVWADPADPGSTVIGARKSSRTRGVGFHGRKQSATEFATVLQAPFRPVLTNENRGSVQVIRGLLHGRPPGLPRLAFWIVDVRDLADVHIAR